MSGTAAQWLARATSNHLFSAVTITQMSRGLAKEKKECTNVTLARTLLKGSRRKR